MELDNLLQKYTRSEGIDMSSQSELQEVMDDSPGALCDNMDSNDVAAGTGASNEIYTKPYVGMEFQTYTEAYNFYNAYALRTGFGIRKTSYDLSKKEGTEEKPKEVIAQTFVCNKEGKKYSCGREGTEQESNNRRESRVGCRARMRITRTTSMTWRISKFIEIHNGHEMISPDKTIKHRSHMTRHKSQSIRSLINILHDQGMAPSDISKVVNVATATAENFEARITPQQCQVELRKGRSNNMGHECATVIEQFANKKITDPEFYFAFELDENRTMRSVFWADGRSRSSYLQFGDVIVFDVTYKTNKLCLPFAPFTGVNHHMQSTLFGCALLADEEEETFVWLFTEWLKCMHGQHPISIITDQDLAMGNAIKRVFPNVRHRYCSWHIGRHITEHIPHLERLNGEGFCKYFKKWYQSSTIEEADKNWHELKEKFKINEEHNTWLPAMYRKRHHWVAAYLRDNFWAGMKSTQRSESINAFFDSFVNSQTRLHEFISAYDKAVAARREAELKEDFLTLYTKHVPITSHPIEVHAGNMYTRRIFSMFQEEIKGSMQLFREHDRKEGSISIYFFSSMIQDSSERHQVVYDRENIADVKCSCALFETTGLLCKHILNIMMFVEQLRSIPEQYILPRWRIDARHRSIGLLGRKNLCSEDQGNMLVGWIVRAKFNEVWENALGSRQLLHDLDNMLSSFAKKLELQPKHSIPCKVAPTTVIPELEGHITIRDPPGPAKTKGRPSRATRMRSQREEAIEKKQKKQRTCQRCFQKGHYRTSCKNPPAIMPPSLDSEDDESADEFDTIGLIT